MIISQNVAVMVLFVLLALVMQQWVEWSSVLMVNGGQYAAIVLMIMMLQLFVGNLDTLLMVNPLVCCFNN